MGGKQVYRLADHTPSWSGFGGSLSRSLSLYLVHITEQQALEVLDATFIRNHFHIITCHL